MSDTFFQILCILTAGAGSAVHLLLLSFKLFRDFHAGIYGVCALLALMIAGIRIIFSIPLLGCLILFVYALYTLAAQKKRPLSAKELLIGLIPSLITILALTAMRFMTQKHGWSVGSNDLGFELALAFIPLIALSILYYLDSSGKNALFHISYGVFLFSALLPAATVEFLSNRNASHRLFVLIPIGLLITIGLALFLAAAFTISRQEAAIPKSITNMLHETEKRSSESLEQLYASALKANHDIKNRLSIIEELIKEGNIEESRGQLEEIRDSLRPIVVTGCPAMDALIRLKSDEAKRHGLQFVYELCPLDSLSITSSELCSLVGNLLDNAIEACLSEGFTDGTICLAVMRVKSMLFIRCKNPTKKVPSVIVDQSIQSTKHSVVHGFGIAIMKDIVRKYDGEFNLTIKDGIFEAFLSMPVCP